MPIHTESAVVRLAACKQQIYQNFQNDDKKKGDGVVFLYKEYAATPQLIVSDVQEHLVGVKLDGLILLSMTAAYRPGPNVDLFKCKPVRLMTVDFMLDADGKAWVKAPYGHLVQVERCIVEPCPGPGPGSDPGSDPKGQLWECRPLDRRGERWAPVRRRLDKLEPNNLHTLHATVQCLREGPVTYKDLLDHVRVT